MAGDKTTTAGRRPRQARSAARAEAALQAAERLLVEVGPEAASIPEIARAASVPRSSIYQFFPSKYALFAELARRHAEQLFEQIESAVSRDPGDPAAVIGAMIDAAIDYYGSHRSAAVLLVREGFAGLSDDEVAAKNERIAAYARDILRGLPTPVVLPEHPDVAGLGVEIALACIRHALRNRGEISHDARLEVHRAVLGYLGSWLPR